MHIVRGLLRSNCSRIAEIEVSVLPPNQ